MVLAFYQIKDHYFIKAGDKKDSSKLPGVKEALAGIEVLVQGYSGELSVPKSTVEKQEVSQVLKPDPFVRDSSNVEVS